MLLLTRTIISSVDLAHYGEGICGLWYNLYNSSMCTRRLPANRALLCSKVDYTVQRSAFAF